VVQPDPLVELPSAGTDSGGGPGQFDRHALWVRNILRSEAGDQVDPRGEIYSVNIGQEEGYFHICLVIQERHSLLEEGEVDKIVALQVGPILAELDEDIIDIHIAMLKTGDRIDRSRPSPMLGFAGKEQGVGIYAALKYEAGFIRVDSADFFEKLLDVPLGPESIGEPPVQQALGMYCLVKTGRRLIPSS